MRKPPSFLNGTFVWSSRGYSLAGPAPVELLKPAALKLDDPWIVIAAAVEHAKNGDHSFIGRLQQWFHAGPEEPAHACVVVTGDAGTEADLRSLQDLMRDESAELRASACVAAMMAGRLWLVPSMLEAYRRATGTDNRETIGYAISDLLDESSAGEITQLVSSPSARAMDPSTIQNPKLRAFAAQFASSDDDDGPTFEPAVEARFEELVRTLGSDQISVWRGKPFSVRKLAEYWLSLVRHASGKLPAESYFVLRQKFEAATGIDCSGFFKERFLQPLAVAAVFEDFLDSGRADAFRDGQRYFFGHPIPG